MIILAILSVFIILKKVVIVKNEKIPTDVLKRKSNDKIVVLKGAAYEDVRKALAQFCDMYREGNPIPPINIVRMQNDIVVVFFPFDIDVDTFCWLVNYLYYPENILYTAEIRAWMTVEEGSAPIVPQLVAKKVMFYIPPNDNEYDNVFLTTQEGVSYKIEFSANVPEQLKNVPIPYAKVPVRIEELMGIVAEEVR